MVFTVFLAHKLDAHNLFDRGLPKVLSAVSLRLSVSYTWHNMPAFWEPWWFEVHAFQVRLWPEWHHSLPPVFAVALIFQQCCTNLHAVKYKQRFNSEDVKLNATIPHLIHRLYTRTMERTITDSPAPYCFRVCLWSQCRILLLATLEWGQWRNRWQQMESQTCPSRYKDLATRNFLLRILASRQLNLWTSLSVYLCLSVCLHQCPCLPVGHTHTIYLALIKAYDNAYCDIHLPACSIQY